jgi:hypothetical protein
MPIIGHLFVKQEIPIMAEPFVRPLTYASEKERHESGGHPSEIKESHPQIDPSSNTTKTGELKRSAAVKEEEKKARFNWRTLFFVMIAMFLAVVVYLLAQLGGSVYNAVLNKDSRPAEERVEITTDPRLRSTVSDTEMKPYERVESRLNMILLDVPYGPSRVLAANTSAPDYRVAPETGPRSYSAYYDPYQSPYMGMSDPRFYPAGSPCSDYLGNSYACVPPYYTDYGPTTRTPYYDTRVTSDRYYGYPPPYRDPRMYYPAQTQMPDPYYNYYSYGTGRCSDYLGNTSACLPPYYTDYGVAR